MTAPTAPATPRLAHQVVPEPDGNDYHDPAVSAADLPAKIATYHAARAWGFYQAWRANESAGTALLLALAEFQLATTWRQLADADVPDIDGVPRVAVLDVKELARDVVTDLASPHVIGPNIVYMLEREGVDPAGIAPYRVAGAGR